VPSALNDVYGHAYASSPSSSISDGLGCPCPQRLSTHHLLELFISHAPSPIGISRPLPPPSIGDPPLSFTFCRCNHTFCPFVSCTTSSSLGRGAVSGSTAVLRCHRCGLLRLYSSVDFFFLLLEFQIRSSFVPGALVLVWILSSCANLCGLHL
jgi:hypothetical protein